MKRKILGLTIGAVVFTGSVIFLPLAAYQIGKLEARLDLLEGKRRVKRCAEFCCPHPGPTLAYDAVAEREFGLKVLMIQGCENEAVYWQGVGYNIQQSDDLERTYGKTKSDEVARKAYQEYSLKLESESK